MDAPRGHPTRGENSPRPAASTANDTHTHTPWREAPQLTIVCSGVFCLQGWSIQGDIYALAVVYMEICTGQLPWRGADIAQMVALLTGGSKNVLDFYYEENNITPGSPDCPISPTQDKVIRSCLVQAVQRPSLMELIAVVGTEAGASAVKADGRILPYEEIHDLLTSFNAKIALSLTLSMGPGEGTAGSLAEEDIAGYLMGLSIFKNREDADKVATALEDDGYMQEDLLDPERIPDADLSTYILKKGHREKFIKYRSMNSSSSGGGGGGAEEPSPPVSPFHPHPSARLSFRPMFPFISSSNPLRSLYSLFIVVVPCLRLKPRSSLQFHLLPRSMNLSSSSPSKPKKLSRRSPGPWRSPQEPLHSS